MSDDDDLRLNALNRYRKTSTRLALEVHSHCEVPAGCGGVVLRWRRPGADIGLSLFTHLRGSRDGLFLDGKPVVEQRVTVAPGEHVLSVEVDAPGDAGFLLLTAKLNPEISTALRPTAASAADGRWKAATQPPPEGWRLPGFDDTGFVSLVERPVPRPSKQEQWRWEMLQEEAKGLGLPSRAKRAWVRWAFRVDVEGFS